MHLQRSFKDVWPHNNISPASVSNILGTDSLVFNNDFLSLEHHVWV